MGLDPSAVDLSGRVVVVTGAAMGIGEATALAAARFGADVAVCDRDSEHLDGVAKEITGIGRRVVTGYLDVRHGDAVQAHVAEVQREFGRVDVLVNNAGGGFVAPFLDVSGKGQAALIDENFTSVTNFVRACVPLMSAGGSIVNITTIEAHRAGPGYAIYSAMKAAVANLTKSLALELGHLGIRVNCIAPDLIPTPGIGMLEMDAPLVHRASADDVAGAAIFLASDLSRFVTGSTVHVDGGTWAAGGWRRQPDGTFTTS
jgi:NAD(P)-dependent dehydrogenase (short-subunit alcohol dehydrogenase family)